MAGAVDVPGNLRVHGFSDDAKNRFAEFNAWIDPIATKMVIESGIPIKLIPLDITNKAPLTEDFLDRFKAKTSGEAAITIAQWWQKNLKPSPLLSELWPPEPISPSTQVIWQLLDFLPLSQKSVPQSQPQ